MLTHNIKILLRTLWRSRSYTILNLLGLTGGLVAFLLIILYVQNEFSFDQYHENKGRIYRVVKQEVGNFYFGTDFFTVTPAPLAPALPEEYPEVETATRIYKRHNILMGVDQQTYLEPEVYAISAETFDIFSFDIKAGNPKNFLREKNTAVLSETMARKYFGDRSPLGQTIRYRNEHPYTVVGVIKDMPTNSHFRMDVMLDFESVAEMDSRSLHRWNNSSFYTYAMLREGANADSLEAKFPGLIAKYVNKDKPEATNYFLQPFLDIHLNATSNFDIAPTGDARKLRIYLLIAFLILLIACINYINLSTAQAFKRAKEVGIRKTVGAYKRHLILQFLGESYFLTLAAMVFALAVIHWALPAFSQFVGRELSLSPVQESWLPPFLLIVLLLVGLLSGAYPSLVLSSFKPALTIKGTIHTGSKKSLLRNVLVVSQFSISAALIISTLIISRQLNYIRTTDMGYARDQILVVDIRDGALQEKLPIVKEELLDLPNVEKVSVAGSMPNSINSNSGAQWPGQPKGQEVMLYTTTADYDYVDLFELEMAQGRSFSREFGNESKSVLLNESAVKALGWEDEPLGRQMLTWNGDTAAVVGILKDFHQHSLHLAIAPMQVFFDETEWQVAVKVSGAQLSETIAAIEHTFQEFSPDYPFEYHFFDEIFERDYQNDLKTGAMANWFTALIIIIACLGLYGLSAFTTEMRIKEIGIRKVLGASVSSILLLLSRNFLSLVFLSFLIAIPVAWYAMSRWLENFVYHVPIGYSIFLWTLTVMLGTALLTVGYKTYTAATNKPVDALQQE